MCQDRGEEFGLTGYDLRQATCPPCAVREAWCCLLHLLHGQAGSLPLAPLRKSFGVWPQAKTQSLRSCCFQWGIRKLLSHCWNQHCLPAPKPGTGRGMQSLARHWTFFSMKPMCQPPQGWRVNNFHFVLPPKFQLLILRCQLFLSLWSRIHQALDCSHTNSQWCHFWSVHWLNLNYIQKPCWEGILGNVVPHKKKYRGQWK